MKKFKTLWYTGAVMIGLPLFLIIVGITAILFSSKSTSKAIEPIESQQVDTVVVEKTIIVRDTITKYIPSKPQIAPTAPKDTLLK